MGGKFEMPSIIINNPMMGKFRRTNNPAIFLMFVCPKRYEDKVAPAVRNDKIRPYADAIPPDIIEAYPTNRGSSIPPKKTIVILTRSN